MIASKPERHFTPPVRSALVGCIIVLAVLSWFPGKHMVRTELGGHAEHAIAYFGTAIVMGVALQKCLRLYLLCGLLTTYAAVLEAGQVLAPNRHASFYDLTFSTAGVLVGGLILWVARPRMKSSARAS